MLITAAISGHKGDQSLHSDNTLLLNSVVLMIFIDLPVLLEDSPMRTVQFGATITESTVKEQCFMNDAFH